MAVSEIEEQRRKLSEKRIEAVQKLLKEPFAAELPETATKVRRNLLAFSVVALAITIWNISVEEYSGFKATGVKAEDIREILMWVIGYHLLHFGWYAYESYLEWRLRLTGSREAFVTGSYFGTQELDYQADPRQATLYSWWTQTASKMGNMHSTLENAMAQLAEWQAMMAPFKGQAPDVWFGSMSAHLENAMNTMKEVKNQAERTEQSVQIDRIPATLRRFDEVFRRATTLTNLRWIAIELSLPIGLGFFAFYKLGSITVC